MNKEDKQFFIGLFKGLEGRFDGLEGRFDGLEGRFDGLEEQVGRNYEAIQKNSRLIQKNVYEIRCLGVEFDDLKSGFKAFGEKQSVIDDRLEKMELNQTEILKVVSDYPLLRNTVKRNSRLLTQLSR